MAGPSGGGGVDSAGAEDGLSRRRLVQLLVGLAFGIPLLVEGLTFLGLVENWTGGEEPSEPSGPTTTPTEAPTPTPAPVGVGEELLPETPQTDRLTDARFAETDDGRELTLVVAVENRDAPAYQLRLSRLVTGAGEQVQGGGGTDSLARGESTTLTARWTVPADAEPAAVEAVATTRTEAGETEVVRRVVPLSVG
jgi:hypothetical protein